ncbi:SMC-Scp complex subunit ScpB [Nanoarchaeota archaeon]
MLKNQLQALLFASGTYLAEEELAKLLGEGPAKVKKALLELQKEQDEAEGALRLITNPKGWKMSVKDPYVPLVRKIIADTELETPVLETLAVIAWKRPILQSEVVQVRGSNAYEHIRELLDLGFITREKSGRTYKVKLAEKFYEYFDVEGDNDIREMFSVVQRPEPKLSPKEQKKLGKLEVVDLEKEKAEQKEKDLAENKLGELEIVDTVDPLVKWKEEHEVLDEIENKLQEITKRTNEHMKEMEKLVPQEEESEEDSEETPE